MGYFNLQGASLFLVEFCSWEAKCHQNITACLFGYNLALAASKVKVFKIWRVCKLTFSPHCMHKGERKCVFGLLLFAVFGKWKVCVFVRNLALD